MEGVMTFEEYANTITWRTVAERTKAKAVWQYQQASIDGLLEDRGKDRARINELEQWIAAIAEDHPQIPDWIQQSARSLLAQEGE
jgi:hypothetical protein